MATEVRSIAEGRPRSGGRRDDQARSNPDGPALWLVWLVLVVGTVLAFCATVTVAEWVTSISAPLVEQPAQVWP